MTGFAAHFQQLSAYNAWANGRLYDAVARLSPAAQQERRPAAYFGSITGTLNHLLVVDRIWMDRFEHLPPAGLALDTVLHVDLEELRAAREAEDARMRRFVSGLREADIDRAVAYRNSVGAAFSDRLGALLTHFFNHQTHHRGQVHALLQAAGETPPPLDYLYFMRDDNGNKSRHPRPRNRTGA